MTRRFRFSLASVLILFAVASIVFAWLRVSVNHEIKLAEEIEELGGKVTWGGLLEGKGKKGRSYIGAIELSGTNVADEELSDIGSLPELTHLNLNDTKITDMGVSFLSSLKKIKQLELSGTQITNEAGYHLGKLKSLEVLKLKHTKISDVALSQIASLSELWMLYLAGTDITDDGINELKRLPNLRTLDIGAKKVTDIGLMKLQDMSQLEVLQLDGASVTEEGIKEFNEGMSNTPILPLTRL